MHFLCLRGLTEIGSESFKLAMSKNQKIPDALQDLGGDVYGVIIAPDDDRSSNHSLSIRSSKGE